ncbi:MAG: TetR/AcrR family transcriptional regulator [Bryobacterales bacterium]|nr:TetR/AcrR family transcriptional regulator [Bryobacterales bacterium]
MTMVIIENQPDIGIRERKKLQTRSHLMETAIRLFAEQGIEATTVDQIAAQADLGKGTLYNYFRTKEDIIVAFMADLERAAMPAMLRLAGSAKPLDVILADFAWHLLHVKRSYRPFVRAFLARMIAPDDSLRPQVVEMQTAIDRTLTTFFGRLQERGLVQRHVAMEDLRLNFKTMHLGLTMLWALEGSPWRQTRRILRSQMSMFAKGIAP